MATTLTTCPCGAFQVVCDTPTRAQWAAEAFRQEHEKCQPKEKPVKAGGRKK